MDKSHTASLVVAQPAAGLIASRILSPQTEVELDSQLIELERTQYHSLYYQFVPDMADPWQEISKRLDERDEVEKRDSEYFQAFAQLSRVIALSGNSSSDRLVKEHTHLWEENESLIARLNSQTLRLEAMGARTQDLTKLIKSQDAQASKLQKKIVLLTHQLAEKDKQLEIINDEHLISQIQQNVLKDQVKKLEQEMLKLKSRT